MEKQRKRPIKEKNIDIDDAIFKFFGEPHLRLNKTVIKIYGIDVALWLADIISRWNYFRTKNKLKDGYFFITQQEIKESTELKFNNQTNIIKQLTDDGILEIKRKGIPPKNWYKINIRKLAIKTASSFRALNLKDNSFKNDVFKALKTTSIYNKKDSFQESSFNNLNNNYKLFLKNWNEQKIIVHKKITSRRKKAIDKVLKNDDYSPEEIFKAFQNYGTVLRSPLYFWDYVWSLEDFLQRGLHRFVDEVDPLNNLKVKKGEDDDPYDF